MTQSIRRPPNDAFVFLTLVLWIIANYGWTICFGFVNDDAQWVLGASRATRALHAWVRPYGQMGAEFFRPLVQLSFVLDFRLGGTNPCVYGATNLLLHAAATLAFWRLVLVIAQSKWVAFVAALLFAVHPSRPEAVVWISGRTELLSVLFIFAALTAYLRSRLALAAVLCALALCSKESAIVVPLLAAAAEVLRLRSPIRRWLALLPLIGVTFGYLIVRAVLLSDFAVGVVGISKRAPGLSADTVLRLLHDKVTIIGELLAEPLPLHGFLRSLVMAAAIATASLWLSMRADPRRAGAIRFSLCWIVLSLVPYAGWVTFMPWYMYGVVAGAALLVVLVAGELLRLAPGGTPRMGIAVAGVLWLASNVIALQRAIADHRLAAERTHHVIDGIVRAVPAPPVGTVFYLDGLGEMVLGGDPSAGKAVLVSGLTEGLLLAYGEASGVAAIFADGGGPVVDGRPTVTLKWNPASRAFGRP